MRDRDCKVCHGSGWSDHCDENHHHTLEGTCSARRCKCQEAVHHPAHYGGADNPYEAIKVIEAWGLGFCLGNTVKYISRAGHKDPAKVVEDLEKARWYLDRAIEMNREISRKEKPDA